MRVRDRGIHPGQRHVALIEIGRRVREHEGAGEGRRAPGLRLHDPHGAGLDGLEQSNEPGQVEAVLQAGPVGLEHDGEAREASRHGQQVLGPQTLGPQRRARARSTPGQQQGPGGVLPELAGEQGRVAQLADHFKVPALICVNKFDLNSALTREIEKYAEEKDIDEIVLSVDDRRQGGLPAKDLLECKMSGIDILDMVSFFERRTGKIRLDILYPSWLYLSEGFHESTFRRVIKRVFDIAAVLLLLPIALPLMVLSILAILIESRGKGPVLYRQTRLKQDNRPFQIYKFRSMVTDAEKDGVARWASINDSRITRVGSIMRALRFDELPQLFNVLKGDMSFVGPRPERPEFVARLADKIPFYEERHRVKPGLTGWAQIRYPYGNTDEDALEKLQYDLYYVKNFSIYLDLLILLQTAEVVMMGKGAQ